MYSNNPKYTNNKQNMGDWNCSYPTNTHDFTKSKIPLLLIVSTTVGERKRVLT